MIGTRAPADPYTFQFESAVESVSEHTGDESGANGTEVVLDETYFYAESGGQPADRGTLDGVDVLDVQHREGEVVHTLDGAVDASADETIAGEVDPAFRTYCMRAHTASHVLYGAGRRLLDDLGYGGFDIDRSKIRVDFETSTEISSDLLVELERLVNRTVWDSREVTWAEHSREEALAREAVAFNAKTEEGLGDEEVRIVEVNDWDLAACGGTHVRNTREIGPVTVLDRSNPGEGLTRVEFAVGPAAIRARAAERAAVLEAAAAANTGVRDLPEAIERFRTERNDAIDERDALREQVVENRLAALRRDAVSRDGKAWVVGTVDGLDANELADRARSAVDTGMGNSSGDGNDDGGDDGGENTDGTEPTVVALVDSEGRYLAVASAGDTDAGTVIESVTEAFGGGGGGSPRVAQGGGLDADPEEIVSFLRGERG